MKTLKKIIVSIMLAILVCLAFIGVLTVLIGSLTVMFGSTAPFSWACLIIFLSFTFVCIVISIYKSIN